MADAKTPDPLLVKAQAILALPKDQVPAAALQAEQMADNAHAARLAQEAAAAAVAEHDAEAAKEDRARAIQIIGESKDALIGRLKQRHPSFQHSVSTDKDTGDVVLCSTVLFGDGERARRVEVARRIPHAELDMISRDDLSALEVEQLHVLAVRVGA